MNKEELQQKIEQFCTNERLNDKFDRKTLTEYKNYLLKFYDFLIVNPIVIITLTKEELRHKIEEFCESEYLDEKSQKTIVDYKNCLQKFYDFLTDDPIIIDKSLGVKYKKYLENSLEKGQAKASSLNKYIIVFNKFLKYLDKNNIEITIKQFRSQKKASLENQMSNQEHKRMLRKSKEIGEYEMYMIMRTFAESGIRVSELKYFTVENLEKGPYINIYNKSKERQVILPGDLYRALKKYCKDNNITEGYIFRSTDPELSKDPNRMINPSTIWRHLKRIGGIARVNLDHIHPHGWRHLFAIAYLQLPGATMTELMDILGHSKMETTSIYTRTTLQEKKKKMEMIKF